MRFERIEAAARELAAAVRAAETGRYAEIAPILGPWWPKREALEDALNEEVEEVTT